MGAVSGLEQHGAFQLRMMLMQRRPSALLLNHRNASAVRSLDGQRGRRKWNAGIVASATTLKVVDCVAVSIATPGSS